MSSPLTTLRRRLADLIAPARRRGATQPSPAPRRADTAAYQGYPGDATTLPDLTYEGNDDGQVAPGEIVWTWVPYEEDHTQGKDRPVLVIGREQRWFIALQLTSQDHDRDAEQERRAGRVWVDIGTGPWDSQGRPSEVRVNRLIRVDPAAVRREGAVLPRARYEQVVAAARQAYQQH
ncbi:MAG: type II toxin-antitoxin system PemK/MazF family toxin [Intrasporangium sp.]|uniref:type II toxin-antitoxin system PemK/MazF family toxin n=1 Tax=Intrasporangium sp. TaxID=1925024 RepID=UPI002648F137|nr:type II toxin-antitoxin system PemK/MazF family toxin [Intrasporangium sp.]MDN5796032.1 type II toxin-antitoxin system PemK/MazF family toxin [Intrasporangium sp.]